MKDSLSLSDAQKKQIYDINMQLNNDKMAARRQYSNPETLRYHLQVVEHGRDSLYHTVLTESQFLMYREKKRNLVNNN